MRKVYMVVGSWGDQYFFGGYQPDFKGSGRGVYTYEVNEADGSLRYIDCGECTSPGIVCVSPDGQYVYCHNETKNIDPDVLGSGGGCTAFRLDRATGKLTKINWQYSMGTFTAFASVSADGQFVALANHGSYQMVSRFVDNGHGGYQMVRIYDDGSIALLPVRADGGVEPVSDLQILAGKGLHPISQGSAHPHSVNFDLEGDYCIACDKGADTVIVFRLDRERRKLMPVSSHHTALGAAPRHLAYYPGKPWVYIVNENNSTLTAYHFDRENGVLTEKQTVCTLYHKEQGRWVADETHAAVGNDVAGDNYTADLHIHPNGRYLYASNRGPKDSLVTYAIDPDTGLLTPVAMTLLPHTNPRGFNILPSGKYLYVGNQRADSISVYAIDPDTGLLTLAHDALPAFNPTCIRFVEADV